MASIYIHIPFCKQACHYCDFHFSTSIKKKTEMILALCNELVVRKKEIVGEKIETIYFGGGTPSMLEIEDIERLIKTVYDNFEVVENPEITLEANPDDLSLSKIKAFSETKINRLSIGVQSFFEDDLRLMNRAHNASDAELCLKNASQYFDNISVDLIYGIPNMSVEKWTKNIMQALSYQPKHISCYALTVEPKTAFEKMIRNKEVDRPSDDLAHIHFEILVDTLQKHHFIHYELSNFGLENYFSKNNSAYWLGKNYIGIGPSAHSFDGKTRKYNINNNALYINSIKENILPQTIEELSASDKFNEYIMTGLRTIWGIDRNYIAINFDKKYIIYLDKSIQKHLQLGLLVLENEIIKTTKNGKFLTDGISSDLFWV